MDNHNPCIAMISKIQDMGRIEEILKSYLDNDIFCKLSKHDPYWESSHDIESNKLDDLRRTLSCLHDNLWDVIRLIRHGQEDC